MKPLENFKKWITGIFKDESGNPSSKRLVGILCALTLCIAMFHSSFSTTHVTPPDSLVDAVALLAFGCLGLSSIDKFTAAKKSIKQAITPDQPICKNQDHVETNNYTETNNTDTICIVCNSEPCNC